MLVHSPGSADKERHNVAVAMSAELSLVRSLVHANLAAHLRTHTIRHHFSQSARTCGIASPVLAAHNTARRLGLKWTSQKERKIKGKLHNAKTGTSRKSSTEAGLPHWLDALAKSRPWSDAQARRQTGAVETPFSLPKTGGKKKRTTLTHALIRALSGGKLMG